MPTSLTTERQGQKIVWAKLIDHTRCIGCHACTTACKSENDVPLSVTRTYVKYVDVGKFPQARRAFQVTRCNQCEDAPCVNACPTASMYTRPDGIVDFAKSICIGCKACIAACPYDAIFINPEDEAAEKCNFCAHRIDVGLEPACVVVCPTEAILIGDLNDSSSAVARTVAREPVTVRRPEKGTRPKLFYSGAHQATLDPLAAKRPEGDLFMWSEQQGKGKQEVVSGHPEHANTSAAAMLSYDVRHTAPWDWRVSLYTWTKGIASGSYLIALLLVLAGIMSPDSPIWQWSAPVLSVTFLAVTGGLLLWDLRHPERFYLIFTRPQWNSWLVRGAFIITGYGLVLGLHIFTSFFELLNIQRLLMLLGLPLAVLSAVYTAYLFAQAKARDLWQSPLLPIQLIIQAFLSGAASLALTAAFLEPDLVNPLLKITSASCLIHLLIVWGEVTLGHVTTHTELAIREMTRGRFKSYFWFGVAALALGILAPWVGLWVALTALVGLVAYEHAYVQAGQSIPLA